MARSRVINIQRVSLSIYVYVSESDTYDTHATPFRGKKKKKKIRRRQVCARSAESTAKRDSTAKSAVGIRLSRTSDCTRAWQFRVSRTSVKIVTRDRLS